MCVCVERAVAEAENDVRARDRRELEEEEQWKMVNNLEEVQSAVRESIKDEVSELDMINVHCRTDINSIGGCGLMMWVWLNDMGGCGLCSIKWVWIEAG